MPCILRVEVAFSQLDPADRIAIVMTNVTLEVTALLCGKKKTNKINLVKRYIIDRIALLAKSDEIVNPSSFGASFDL
jgi:hypothetical protein